MTLAMLLGAFIATALLFETCGPPRSLVIASVITALVGLGGAYAVVLIARIASP